jgi:hypothetical protein
VLVMSEPSVPKSFRDCRFVAEFTGLRVKVGERFEDVGVVIGDLGGQSDLLDLRQTRRRLM